MHLGFGYSSVKPGKWPHAESLREAFCAWNSGRDVAAVLSAPPRLYVRLLLLLLHPDRHEGLGVVPLQAQHAAGAVGVEPDGELLHRLGEPARPHVDACQILLRVVL